MDRCHIIQRFSKRTYESCKQLWYILNYIDYHMIVFSKLASQIYTFLNPSYCAWMNIIGNDANVMGNKNKSIIGNTDIKQAYIDMQM